ASGAVLLQALERAPADRRGAWRPLLVADPSPLPVVEGGPALPVLRAARREVQTIGRMLGGTSDVLVGRRASEAAVRAALPDAGIAHFATHALVREANPLTSHLLLGAGSAPATVGDDGRL